MSKPRLISPLLDGFVMGDPISEHHGVCCCPAMQIDTEQKYMVKVISIPASQVQLDALLLSGAYSSREDALAYFAELAEGVNEEAQLLQKLSNLEGFAAYSHWQMVPMEEGVGFELYLLSPYRLSLERQFRQNSLTHLGAVNLGLDLCAALTVCRRSGKLYVDLKPGNIFITDNQEYRIGDLGFISLDSLKYASLSDKYRSSYTAPEITDAYSSLNSTLDIYAAGLILYQAFNNNALPFEGGATSDPLPPPAYADYEMAQIILKACDPDPSNRWEDPVQMGQALVSYLQRNTVNDTPIIPSAIPEEAEAPTEEEPSEELPDEQEEISDQIEDQASEEDGDPVIPESTILPIAQSQEEFEEDSEQFVIDGFAIEESLSDEEVIADLENTEVSQEVSEMLAQADELIAHETPAPVVAPDPIEVPMPAPLVADAEEEPQQSMDEEPLEEAAAAPEAVMDEASTTSAVAVETADEEENQQDGSSKMSNKQFDTMVAILASVLVLLLLAVGAFFFYEKYYLQPIQNISLDGHEDRLLVTLDTDIDNDLLTIVCQDTYGNSLTQGVADNKALFTNLRPGTKYTVYVQISGMHKLVGTTASSHTTPAQTNIVSFTAITGDKDGTVILNFSVQGPENTAWRVAYSAPGVSEKIMPCTAHMAVITGLEVGVTYTFRLVSVADLYVVGNSTLEHTVSKVVYPENLQILGFEGGTLRAAWETPKNTVVESWTVRCYNTEGFDTTITVTEPTASFPGLDPAKGYTLDVKAAGMSESKQVSVSANSVTFKNIQIDDSTPGQLNIQWEFEGTAPAGGWRLLYTIDGSEKQLVTTDQPSCIISPVVPGAHYEISFELPGGISLFGGSAEHNTAVSSDFQGYDVTKADMTFQMCITPDKEGWQWSDVPKKDYTSDFSQGTNASFFIKLSKNNGKSDDNVETLLVIRDVNGTPVAINSHNRAWNSMWNKGYCVIEMPIMPQIPGNYTVDIYFNGGHVHSQSFTVI